MHNFTYVTKKEAAPIKATLIEVIKQVQDAVRDDFTFQYRFIGSSSRGMITQDTKSNIGFDFDVNIEVNDDNENYSPEEIRIIIHNALNKVVRQYGYDFAEDSTRVLTIKVKDRMHSRIVHSCDFAIVYNCNDGRQQYIRYDKARGNYTWEYQKSGFCDLQKKADWLKANKHWQEVLDRYIEKKNENVDPDKHSRSLYAETINDICMKYHYGS